MAGSPPDRSLDLFAPESAIARSAPDRAEAPAGADEVSDQTTRPGAAAAAGDGSRPLAERMRPRSLDEVIGQEHLVGADAPLRQLVESGELPSIVLWGPPGCGKTSLAPLLAGAAGLRFASLSAVMAGVREVRGVVERAEHERRSGRRTLLFIDEIHRFNRAQQDALLPHTERGTVTLVGATTENPSFQVNAPLLSRCRVFVLERLPFEAIERLMTRALRDPERGLGEQPLPLRDHQLRALAEAAEGDARRALGLLDELAALHRGSGSPADLVDDEMLRRAVGPRVPIFDRDREEHYNVASALIKSLRASDPDAGLYYLARMLEGGEDPLFVARRLVVFASEDVGNAAPEALALATASHLAVERIGMPEGRIPLAQAVTFLACAPKSRASYQGIGQALEDVRRHGSLPVPMHLRNAPTALMKELGYGRGAVDPHREPAASAAPENLPGELAGTRYYEPRPVGHEAAMAERLTDSRSRQSRP